MTAATETRVCYIADTRASQFTVQVFSGGLLSAFGHSPTIAIHDFAGEVQVSAEEFERSSLKVTINPESMTVQNDVSDKDRREMERTMKQEILEVSSYPQIEYECSDIEASKVGEGQYAVTLQGELTMHGVTRAQVVPARVVISGDLVRAFGGFSLLQTDYELKLASIAGGALKVKDEIKFSFNIVARKKE